MGALLCVAGVLDIEAMAALWSEHVATAAVLHVAALGGLTLGVYRWLAHLPRRQAAAAAVTAAGIAGAVPGLGLIGLLLVALPRWSKTGQASGPRFVERAMPSFSEEALNARSMAMPTLDPLSPAADVEARVTAVKSLRNMEATRAIPLLRRALADPAEDVRLLAHAILDRRERGVRADLEASLAQLEALRAQHPEGSGAERHVHVALASHFWELAYAGFVGGDGARAVLQKAAQHAIAGATHPGERATALIAIRAYLKLGELDRAAQTITWAREIGIPGPQLASLAAELAFLQRRFSQIDDELAALSPLSSRQPYVAQVMRFWGERGAS
ncbi:MAG: hypothetical protein ABW252_05340 [Polyangiales bacterium]